MDRPRKRLTDDEFRRIHERTMSNIEQSRRTVEKGSAEAKFYLDRVDRLTHYSMSNILNSKNDD